MSYSKYTINCMSCKTKNDLNEDKRTIYQDEICKVVLRADNQIWLGRCIIVPWEHVSPKEMYTSRTDLLLHIGTIIALLNKAFAKAYDMDMSNIAQLGNLTEDENGNKTAIDEYFHVHFHFIPRYKEGKIINILNHNFSDPQWGKALNIDPKAGLPVYSPDDEMIARIKYDLEKAITEIKK